MKYSFRGLRANEITRYFRGCVPCKCWDDPDMIYRIPRYDVDVKYGNTYYGNGSRLIKEITVECDCCGAKETYDVENDDVYSGDISW